MAAISAQVIDAGNSAVKLALFSGKRLEHYFFSPRKLASILQQELRTDLPLIISNVGGDLEWLPTGRFGKFIQLDHSTALPIKIEYDTPKTLGVDRIANACGAARLFPSQDVLVIDIGSCITYDLVQSDNTFTGGAISPGLNYRLRAMNNFSAKLPLVEFRQQVSLVAQSTKQALLSGAYHGMRNELDGMIEDFQSLFPGLIVLLTGGDMHHFEKALKSPIFAHPNLTLQGLHEVLRHNIG